MSAAVETDTQRLVRTLLRATGVLRCLSSHVAHEVETDYATVETLDAACELVEEAYTLADQISSK